MSKDKQEIKDQIMAAAEKRFLQYGFNKTTMGEIAKDCHMSAANIYRFFKNKNDIASEMASQSLLEAQHVLKELVRDTRLTPVEKLKSFTLAKLQMNYKMFSQQPNYFEIVNYIVKERDDLLEKHHDKITSFIAEILAEGNRMSLFDVDDIFTVADTFLKAVTLFICPVLVDMYTLEEMEDAADKVVTLLVKGLEKR
jgi:AcrR family transcriptional regulator